jgi:quinol monooxygenase YgiN
VLVVIATFDMAPEDRGRFVADRTSQVGESLAEDGCAEYALALDAFDPGRVRLVERWRDAEALAAHVAAIQRRGGPPAGVAVTARKVTVIEGEVTSESGG